MKTIKQMIGELYVSPPASHKGENGRLLIIGGSAQYHGAPLFSIHAARRFVDLLYFLPAERDMYLIEAVKQVPEVIVVEEDIPEKVDCTLFGVGLGPQCVSIEQPADPRKMVIDAGGLNCIKDHVPKGCLITPHEGEFARLFGVRGTKENVKKMAKKHSCVILKKGHDGDIISDGARVFVNTLHNPGMTKGGTGDSLAGLAAALACKNGLFEAACAAAYVNGYAAGLLRKKMGFNFCTSDLTEMLGEAYFRLKKT